MIFKFFYIHKKQLAKVIALVIFIAIIFAVYFVKNAEKEDDWSLVSADVEKSGIDIQNSEESIDIIVDVDGEIVNPSVYILPFGSRIYEAIKEAGGLTVDADTRHINLAAVLEDGTKLYIPTKKQEEDISKAIESHYFISTEGSSDGNLINLNNADSSSLQQLPRIGPSTAEKIISYRKEYGRFKTKEELMNVSGIGEKTYESLKNLVTVE